MELKVDKNQHLRHLLFECNRNLAKLNTASRQKHHSVYEEAFIAERATHKLFDRFKYNQFELNDSFRPGRPVEFDEQKLDALPQEENHQTILPGCPTTSAIFIYNCHRR